MRIMQSPGPLNWEIARQVSDQVAVEDDADQTIDEATRVELLDLARAAAGPVMSATGIDEVLTLSVDILDRRGWARRHLGGTPARPRDARHDDAGLHGRGPRRRDGFRGRGVDERARTPGRPNRYAGSHEHAGTAAPRGTDRIDGRIPRAVRARGLRPPPPIGRRADHHLRRAQHRPLRRCLGTGPKRRPARGRHLRDGSGRAAHASVGPRTTDRDRARVRRRIRARPACVRRGVRRRGSDRRRDHGAARASDRTSCSVRCGTTINGPSWSATSSSRW